MQAADLKKLGKLLDKKILNFDELQEIEENPLVKMVEDNGLSGLYPSCHWYTVKFKNKEFEVYVK